MAEDDFDPKRVLEVLARHGVGYVLIGGIAAVFYGHPYPTYDVDICPSPDGENLARLAAALIELSAWEWDPATGERVSRIWTSEMLAGDTAWLLVTEAGSVDLIFVPAGTSGFDDLAANSVLFDVDGLQIPAASLQDIIRLKEATGREKDLVQLPALRRLLELR